MKHVVVTGGNGKLGRAVVQDLLEHGYAVRIIDRAAAQASTSGNAETLALDLADDDAVYHALEGADAVVHLAAIPSPMKDPWPRVYANNTIASYNVLHAAATLGIRHVCAASSINATGVAFSRAPRFDYFPLDEQHPTYTEDPYSLSKWVAELQADSIVRRWGDMTIASLRFHGIRETLESKQGNWAKLAPADVVSESMKRNLWGYVDIGACARACRLSIEASYKGHEVFYIVAPNTYSPAPSLELARQYYPQVPVVGDLSEHKAFFNTRKAERLLGWTHDIPA
ncbi:MAG TPA: NAD(P)-dependent oxidoreductase [Anaerolineae bacterium]